MNIICTNENQNRKINVDSSNIETIFERKLSFKCLWYEQPVTVVQTCNVETIKMCKKLFNFGILLYTRLNKCEITK